MNLTKNGQDFFCKCTTVTFNDEDILQWGLTNNDLQTLMDEDYINYDEDTDQFYWVGESRL